MNKKRKVFLSILILALMFGMSYSVSSEVTNTFTAEVDFYDMEPMLNHPIDPDDPNEKYVDTVISCNMVLKPKTQIHLSRYCESAVSNLNFYFNGSGNVQKGPDYNNAVEDEIFYPSSGRISNSYLGGTISYKIASEFQTKTLTGDKINLETPSGYQTAVIISSITKPVDLGVETVIYVPTGDQSQPDWVGRSGVFPGFEGVEVDWEFNFGYIDDSNISGAFGLFKVKSKEVHIINLKAGLFNPAVNGGKFKTATNFLTTALNDEDKAVVLSAKKLSIQYNENVGACDGDTILMEDGWQDLPEEDFAKFSIGEDGNITYPNFMNAWIRVSAIIEIPEEGYRPAKRVRVKSRVSTYGGFKFGNLKEGDVVKIYNVSGKKVAELNAGTSDGFEWLGREGTNNSGDWAKSGIYIYQIKLKDGGKIISGTISFVW